MFRRDVAHVERKMEVERVLASACDPHGRHTLTKRFIASADVLLIRAVEQPYVRRVGNEQAQIGFAGLHVLPVDQHVRLLAPSGVKWNQRLLGEPYQLVCESAQGALKWKCGNVHGAKVSPT